MHRERTGRIVHAIAAAVLLGCQPSSDAPTVGAPAAPRDASRPEGSSSPWAAAALRGATFRALGNEPSWNLELHPDRLVLVTDLGARRSEAPYHEPTLAGPTTTYRADGQELTVVVEQRACADSMSGEAFVATVTVTLDGQTFHGCGRPLP
jgi:putative lipoprotein